MRRNIERIKISILKYLGFLNDSTLSKFVTKKWIKVYTLSGGQYFANKNIRFKILALRSDLCDYSDAYIVMKGNIDLLAAAGNENYQLEKDVVLENNARFRSYISKINSKSIDNTENLDIVMPMCNLLEYIHNYSMTS